MGRASILVVEDDRKTAELLRLYLERAGFLVTAAHDGREGLELARTGQPDLLLLDLMLPGIDGVEICRILRRELPSPGIPVIMLTARSTEDDRLTGLDSGADDYVTKPFSPREVVARVRAVLRRAGHNGAETLEEFHSGALSINFIRHEVRLNGQVVYLTPKEFDLLTTMALEAGRAFSREELLEKAFGFDYDGLERTVDVHVMKLRKKLEPDLAHPRYIQTVFGIGYKFIKDEE
jgi:DNA-binding response OmpR family regulator